jgi:hypothetical protein
MEWFVPHVAFRTLEPGMGPTNSHLPQVAAQITVSANAKDQKKLFSDNDLWLDFTQSNFIPRQKTVL